ncbi:hypothetical protein [Kribbella sp. NPDC023855]|uniref:hypothetical protein n=1 Tax=Kribbella sp. NPDC023855 TaxID=3154698 RepID=UPI0033DEDA49
MTRKPQSTTWGWADTGPVWGARAFTPKSGQDHLGLGSVSSDRILPTLSPGINVLTIHPRYWSFYSWILDDFWAADLLRTRSAFQNFYRPREALFAMACHVCDAPEHQSMVANVVGSRRVGSRANDTAFDPQFDYIKEALGGYSLYYRSAMELTGVLVIARPTNGFPFDAPTPYGRALAAAYRAAVSDSRLAARLESGDLVAPIARDVLVEFARKGCLCQLGIANNYDLPLLQDLFLHSGAPAEIAYRGETLRLLLDLSQCTPDEAIKEQDFRQFVYFRALEGDVYTSRAELVDVARRWRVYQGRDEIWPRNEVLDEHAVYVACRDYDVDDGKTLLALIALVLLLRERFGLPSRVAEYAQERDLLSEGGALRIGMARFMHVLNQRLLRQPTLAELAEWLIQDFVIVQHERVATAKLPDDTYRVRRVGDNLRFFPQEVPAVFNDSRFLALSTIVHELGWVSTFREPDRSLTAAGRSLLANGDLPSGALDEAAAAYEFSGSELV